MSGETVGDRSRTSGEVPQPPAVPLDAWLVHVRDRLGLEGSAIDRATEAALLDLTRVAAHTSERIAGPMTAYLVGIALAGVPIEERAARVRDLVTALAAEDTAAR